MSETLKTVESPFWDGQGFDLRTQVRDARTGRLVKDQPYLRHCHRDKGTVYERDGKFWYETGEEAKDWGPVTPDKPLARAPQQTETKRT